MYRLSYHEEYDKYPNKDEPCFDTTAKANSSVSKDKKKVKCSKCNIVSVLVTTYYYKCKNHHKKNEPCCTSLSYHFH